MADETTDTGMTEDAFELAFMAAATEGSGGSETDNIVTDPPEKEEVQPDTEQLATDDASEETKVVEEKASAEAKAAEEAKVAEDRAKREAKARAAEEKAAREAEEAKAKAEAEAAKKAEERSKPETFSEDEKKLLEEATSVLPEMEQILSAQARVITANLEKKMESMFDQLASKFEERLKPVDQVAQTYVKDKFVLAVEKVHPDALQITNKVEEWIKSQPPILQKAYDAVLDSGTVEETIELLNTYKAATGEKAEKKSKGPSPEEVEAKKEKEAKLKALEGVRGRSTVERATIDPDDFDGAFKKFAATA